MFPLITLRHFQQESHESDVVSLSVHRIMMFIYPISSDINCNHLNKLVSIKFIISHLEEDTLRLDKYLVFH